MTPNILNSTHHGRNITPKAAKKSRPRRSIPSQRGTIEIIGDILTVCAEEAGAKKTRIMYRANMSHEMLRRYLPMLLMRGLLDKSPDCAFTVTARGATYLESYMQLKSLMR